MESEIFPRDGNYYLSGVWWSSLEHLQLWNNRQYILVVQQGNIYSYILYIIICILPGHHMEVLHIEVLPAIAYLYCFDWHAPCTKEQ